MTPAELRARRCSLDLTQDQMGRALGVAANTVARWERGARAIGRPDLVQMMLEHLEAEHVATHPTHPEEHRPVVSRHSLGDRRTNNLPSELSSFVGREPQLQELVAVLGTARLVTLTGAGGVGKTRLAYRLARMVLEDYTDFVWLADLASVADGSLVEQVVASVLKVRPQSGRPLLETLASALRAREMLLLLDNCEHVVASASELVQALLEAAPNVRVLTTSREPLQLPGEIVWRVPSLSLPAGAREFALHELIGYEAVQLFSERARGRYVPFSITDKNYSAVLDVCRRLDGIPLAIELAATRLETLTVEQIAARLSDRFQLLTDCARTAPPRQQTLRSAVTWSYDLLDKREQRLLARLSVFAGGWSLEAAEGICADSDVPAHDVPIVLSHLVSKSLVQVAQRDGLARYRLLETIRQFAAERLRASAEDAKLRCLHRDWFLSFAEQAAQGMPGPNEKQSLDRLDHELENLRLAFEWCVIDAAGLEVGLRVAGRLWWFWYTRNHWQEGRTQLERLLAVPGLAAHPRARGEGLYALANILRAQGELTMARTVQQECLEIRRATGDRGGMSHSLGELGRIARSQGDCVSARALLQQALALNDELGDQWGVARQLNALGDVAFIDGDTRSAQALYERSLSTSRVIGDRLGVTTELTQLASVAEAQGQLRQARALLVESLAVQKEDGTRWELSARLERLAGVVCRLGQAHAAAQLFGAAERLREVLEDRRGEWRPAQHERYQRNVALTRVELGDAAFEADWAAGRLLELDETFELVRGLHNDGRVVVHGRRNKTATLSAREREVARLVANGLTNRQIGSELVITESTAAKHVENIREKLGVTSRAQIAAWVMLRSSATP
jgi:predicted ATPase/DNA-binding CsgD family transcriptional regulator/transcriptional regulator with XRE-family HTH domain